MADPSDEARYREYWAYIRHVETVRFTLGGLILTAASAILAVVLLRPDDGRFAADVEPWAFLFLATFVGVSAWFMVEHKASYNHYFDQLREMDSGLRLDPGEWRVWWWAGPFEIFLLLITLIQVAIVLGAAFGFPEWSLWQRIGTPVVGIAFVAGTWGRQLGLRRRRLAPKPSG